MQGNAPRISALIEGRKRSRAEVLAWEDRRIDAAARKLGLRVPAGETTESRREALLEAKLRLGDDAILDRLGRELRASDRFARALTSVTYRRIFCTVGLEVQGGTAEQFLTWYEHMTFTSDHHHLLRACPDHYVLRMRDDRLEVVETTGGGPLASRFEIDYQDVSSLESSVSEPYPVRSEGVALASNGRPIGGVRHQFRSTAYGFEAALLVEFPLLTPPPLVWGHRWHLACEFSNWIECAFAARS